MYKHFYSRFLAADPERLHFAAHSHHAWPDVTRQAQLQYWDDSAKYMDHKWDHVFGEIVPKAQRHIAETIGVSDPSAICFAPNTHDFVTRLLSCFEPGRALRILSTDSEFHSFRRQLRRLLELPNVEASIIDVQPFKSFTQRFKAACAKADYDLIYLSQVFFNSSFLVRDLDALLSDSLSKEGLLVVDGYHAFMAVPFSLQKLQQKIFYLAGGYKYAQSGEGACFMYVPPARKLRPIDTGWFAYYDALETPLEKPEKGGEPVKYSPSGMRFAGATFDPSGIYRFNAVMDLLHENKLSVKTIHEYVQSLQRYFLDALERIKPAFLSRSELIFDSFDTLGHFLSFKTAAAKAINQALDENKIITDYRGDILRFGFGMHQDMGDIDKAFSRMRSIKV